MTSAGGEIPTSCVRAAPGLVQRSQALRGDARFRARKDRVTDTKRSFPARKSRVGARTLLTWPARDPGWAGKSLGDFGRARESETRRRGQPRGGCVRTTGTPPVCVGVQDTRRAARTSLGCSGQRATGAGQLEPREAGVGSAVHWTLKSVGVTTGRAVRMQAEHGGAEVTQEGWRSPSGCFSTTRKWAGEPWREGKDEGVDGLSEPWGPPRPKLKVAPVPPGAGTRGSAGGCPVKSGRWVQRAEGRAEV